MEYTIDKLEDAIMYYLTLEPDTPKSVYKIYNDLIADKICPSLNEIKNKDIYKMKFTTLCHTMDTRYTNLKKFHANQVLYLVFTTKNVTEFIDNNYPTAYTSNTSELPKNCDMIEYILNNPDYCSDFDFTDFIDGNDTVLHVICRNNNVNLLNKLLDRYNVDVNIKNKNNQMPVEVTMSTEVTKKLIEYQYKKREIEYENRLIALQSYNTTLRNESVSNTQKARNFEKVHAYYNFYKYGFYTVLALLALKVIF